MRTPGSAKWRYAPLCQLSCRWVRVAVRRLARDEGVLPVVGVRLFPFALLLGREQVLGRRVVGLRVAWAAGKAGEGGVKCGV